MKSYSITATVSFSIEASSESTAQVRAERVMDSLISMKLPKSLPTWWPDLEAPEIEIEEES